MKNARLVLFAMIFSAPLACMDGSDVQSRFVKEIREEGAVSFYDMEARRDLSDNDVHVICDGRKHTDKDMNFLASGVRDYTRSSMHKKNSVKLLQVSGLSALALVGSLAAQKYAGDNEIVKNPLFAKTQIAFFGSAVTTAALAIDEARQAHPDFLTNLWNSVFAARVSVKAPTVETSTAKSLVGNEGSLTDFPNTPAAAKKATWLNSRNICVTSTLAYLATFGAQHYTGSQDVNLRRAQIATGATAVTFGATAVAYSSYPTYFYNLVFGVKQANAAPTEKLAATSTVERCASPKALEAATEEKTEERVVNSSDVTSEEVIDASATLKLVSPKALSPLSKVENIDDNSVDTLIPSGTLAKIVATEEGE